MLKDKFNRTIKYLRISLTESCNLHCFYCRPNQDKTYTSCQSYLTPDEMLLITRVFSELGVSHVRLSGGEPLLKKDICLLVKGIGRLSGIKDVSLTTNGILLKKFAPSLKNAGLHRLNISLDSITLYSIPYQSVPFHVPPLLTEDAATHFYRCRH